MGRGYISSLPETLREAYVAAQEDPQMMELRDELALLRTLLARYVEQCAGEIDRELIHGVSMLVDKISKLHTNIVDYEYKARQVIPIAMIPVLIRAMKHIISRVVNDERIAGQIGQEIGNLPMLLVEPVKEKNEATE